MLSVFHINITVVMCAVTVCTYPGAHLHVYQTSGSAMLSYAQLCHYFWK